VVAHGLDIKGTAQNQSEAVKQRYSPDLMKDPYLRFLDNYYYVNHAYSRCRAFCHRGLDNGRLGDRVMRVAVSWHCTWMVNSVTPIWGHADLSLVTIRVTTRLSPRSPLAKAGINNHHTYPRSAKHGLTWKEFDINWYQLQIMEKLGLISNVYAYDLATESETPKELRQAA